MSVTERIDMVVHAYEFRVSTKGSSDVIDLTSKVEEFLTKSNLRDGIATVFVPGSTAGITTIEFESGAIDDLKQAINRLAPINIPYSHDARWGDGN